MKFLCRKYWWLLVAGVILVVFRSYFQIGVPFTHDGENHLARFANYKVAVREGQIPPRFAPNLMNHYGYPVFNYNYPLLNIASLPLSVLSVPYEVTFKILMVAGVAMGAMGALAWLKICGFSLSSRVFATAVLVSSPFVANLVLVRGSIGELWALALFPWLLWLVKKIKQEERVPWLVSVPLILAFFLSHNVSVLFGTGVWLLYAVAKFKKEKRFWGAFLPPLLLAGLMSLWFWLPALAEQSFVVLGGDLLSSQYTRHFARSFQLVFAPLEFGYSYESAVDTMSFSVGLVAVASLGFLTLWLLRRKPKSLKRETSWLWFFVLLGWALLFFQTSLSSFFWKSLPLVHFIQFPWRLTLFFIVIALPVVASVFHLHRWVRWVLYALLFVQILSVWRLQPADILHKQNVDYDVFSRSTSTIDENRAAEFTYIYVSDWQPGPSVATGSAEISVHFWNGSRRAYHVQANEETLMLEPTMYFPGWETRVNDELISYVPRPETEGRIGYWLAEGEYEVTTRFTQNTWARTVGNTASGIAVFFWGWLVWRETKHSFGKS